MMLLTRRYSTSTERCISQLCNKEPALNSANRPENDGDSTGPVRRQDRGCSRDDATPGSSNSPFTRLNMSSTQVQC